MRMSVEETADSPGLYRARRLVREQLDRKIGPVLLDAFPFAGKRCERLTGAVLKRFNIISWFQVCLKVEFVQPLLCVRDHPSKRLNVCDHDMLDWRPSDDGNNKFVLKPLG